MHTWNQKNAEQYQLSQTEILGFARKLSLMYSGLKKVKERINAVMMTGQDSADNRTLNIVKYSIRELESLLGTYRKLCNTKPDANIDMIAMAESLAPDPLAEYLAKAAEVQVGGPESGEDAGRKVVDGEEDDELVRLFKQALDELDNAEWNAARAGLHGFAPSTGQESSIPQPPIDPRLLVMNMKPALEDIVHEVEVLTDNISSLKVIDEFAAAMNMLDRLSFRTRTERC